MNDERYDFDDDLEVVDPQELMEAFVLDDPAHEQRYLRTRWIGRIMMQLIDERIRHGLTQRELGERMGKPQSSVARLERGDDLKLSVLWDYLAAMGKVPEERIPLTSLETMREPLSKYVAGTHDNGASPILRVQHWRKNPLSPDEDIPTRQGEEAKDISVPDTNEEPDTKVIVA